MNLVIDHVLQPLVVGGTKEDLGVELASCEAIIEHLVATEVIAILVKQLGDLLNIDSVVERRGITNLTLVSRDLQQVYTWIAERLEVR